MDEIELHRRDQSAIRHPHAKERAIEISHPEPKKVGELGKARRKIVVLPDVALEQRLVIGKAVVSVMESPLVLLLPPRES